MKDTAIEWTDNTANFWWGCLKVSPGCQHCYAETLTNRWGKSIWGPVKTTDREYKKAVWQSVPKWDREAGQAGKRVKLFVMSMGDFLEDHPQVSQWRSDACDLLASLQHTDVQMLTKRPENAPRLLPASWFDNWPQHIWMGASAENQEQADARMPHLLAIPAKKHFLSCEPLLGPIDLPYYHTWFDDDAWASNGPPSTTMGLSYEPDSAIDWVIVGGESGPGARPMHPDWVRSIRDQCQAAGVPFFFKQWGEWAPDCLCHTKEPHSTIPRPQPGLPGVMFKCGKKAAGHVLDGRIYQEMPKP